MNIHLKEYIRTLIKYTPSYRKAKKKIMQLNGNDLDNFLHKAVKNVPFYQALYPSDIAGLSLTDFPVIRK